MEQVNPNGPDKSNVISNTYVENIKKLEERYVNASVFPIGKIINITYADSGKTLILEISGDLPTGFQRVNIIIVHPDSDRDGWIGKGHIGFSMGGSGIDIGSVPLSEETIATIKEIYSEFTGRQADLRFDTHYGHDTTKFANPNFYQDIIERLKK